VLRECWLALTCDLEEEAVGKRILDVGDGVESGDC
jgi:hypothetical protein